MPGNHPQESIQHSEYGKSLKSRIIHLYGKETARHIGLFEKLCIKHIKFRRRGITQKKANNIVILAAITKAMFAQSPNPPQLQSPNTSQGKI
jgi:hypothetical protein